MKNELGLFESKNGVYVSSRDVAEKFGKRHNSIIQTIENIINDTNGSTSEMYTIEFKKQEFIHEQNSQTYFEYFMNKRSFILLMMRLKGETAFELQNKYIDRFEYMESIINQRKNANWQESRQHGKQTRLAETDVIRDKLIPLAIEQGSKNYAKLYMTYSKLINSLLKINSDTRNNLPYHYLTTIDMLERIIENIISSEVDKNTHYKEIYQVCKLKCQLAVELSFLPKLEPLKIN